MSPASSHRRHAPADQASGLLRLFAPKPRCLLPVAANPFVPGAQALLETLSAALAVRGRQVLVVDAASSAPAPHETALFGLIRDPGGLFRPARLEPAFHHHFAIFPDQHLVCRVCARRGIIQRHSIGGAIAHKGVHRHAVLSVEFNGVHFGVTIRAFHQHLAPCVSGAWVDDRAVAVGVGIAAGLA